MIDTNCINSPFALPPRDRLEGDEIDAAVMLHHERRILTTEEAVEAIIRDSVLDDIDAVLDDLHIVLQSTLKHHISESTEDEVAALDLRLSECDRKRLISALIARIAIDYHVEATVE
jgi:acyl-CoA thioesterase FadM